MKNKKKHPKWIVWSFDEEEGQTLTDIVRAATAKEAEKKAMKTRNYATLDQVCPSMLLSEYVANLQEELDKE